MEQKKPTLTLNRVLAAIQQLGTVSIRDIATYCNQSIPNVTRYVESMLECGLLCERSASVAATGRKPKLFSLNPDYGYIVGIELGLLHVVCVSVFSLDGNVIHKSAISYDCQLLGEAFISNVMNAIDTIFSQEQLDQKRILQIVIANPGIVDSETGTMTMSAESATWSDLPLRTLFMEHFGAPTKVINDVNLAAIGEKDCGAGKGYENFVFIRLDTGLKAGILLKDRLYQGDYRAAGEIGYSIITTMKDGKLSRVTAESLFAIPSILECVAEKLPANPDDLFYSITGGDVQNVTIDNVVKVLGTSSYVDGCIKEIFGLFGYLLVNLITALDISIIIIGGDIIKFGNYFFKPVRDILTECLPYPPAVVSSSLGDDVALRGAFSVGMENFLSEM